MFASDHIPVVVDFIVPSRLQLSTNAIAFGTVIQGGPAAQTLSVANPADVPGDALDYSFNAAPAGFTAPTGPFAVPPGGTGPLHAIAMDTGTIGITDYAQNSLGDIVFDDL